MINIIYIIYIYTYKSISISTGFVQKCAIFHPIHGHPMGQVTTSMMNHGTMGHWFMTHLAQLFQSKSRWNRWSDFHIAGWFMSWKISQQKWDDDWGYPHDNQKKKVCLCMVYHQPSRLLLICSSLLLNAAGVHVLGSHLWSQGNVLKCNGVIPSGNLT